MWIVSVGDPFNGLTLYGPFDTEEDAFEWGDNSEYEDHQWNIVELQAAPGAKSKTIDDAYNDGYKDGLRYGNRQA